MGQDILQIRGGTIVSAYGMRVADLWVQDGKVKRISCETPEAVVPRYAAHVETIDATDYYIMPGFVSFTRMQARQLRDAHHYMETIFGFIQKGITMLIDTIALEPWMDHKQSVYQLATHFNSPLDYACQFSLEAGQCTPKRVRELAGVGGVRLVQIRVRDAAELDKLDWDKLAVILHFYRLSLELHVVNREELAQEQRREIIGRWLYHTQRGKIHSLIGQANPFDLSINAPYYANTLLDVKQCHAVFAYLIAHWHNYLPVMCGPEQIVLPPKRRAWNPDDVLPLIARLASANAAKAAGCYPQKGAILPGSDADLLFLHKDEWLTNFDLSTNLNFSENCLPARVMSRGRWVYQDGVHQATPGSGKLLRGLKPFSYML
ncbi:amidohydrolase family protein [Brevibacillus fluminis]|uniref:amidohydrolase family protein n=1 Tax=Brevibacillus fluminis TaxID=511487 RepID=UPI003F8A0FA4